MGAPDATREAWAGLVDQYIKEATNLQRVVALVDARHGPKESDERLWDLLQSKNRQLMGVLTKVDCVDPMALNRVMAHVVSLLQQLSPTHVWPYVHAVSGLHGLGVDDLRASLSAVASDFAG